MIWEKPRYRLWLVLLCFAPITKTALGQNVAKVPATMPSIESVVAGMKLARDGNDAGFRTYTVTRNYKLFDKERIRTKSQVTAEVTFVPPSSKSYAIQHTYGAGLGETIVRRILQNEVEIARDQASTDFSPQNYDFRFIAKENANGRPCYILELLPRRRAKNLLRGKMWVDAETHLVQRVDGEPAKAPSWWLRRVHISLAYGDVAGMWLQTGLEATATVRLFGTHTIVSQNVAYKVGTPALANAQAGISRMEYLFHSLNLSPKSR